MTNEEITYCHAKRAQGFSWQAISRMVAKCELDVRRNCVPVKATERKPAKPVKTEKRKTTYVPGLGKNGQGAMDLLYAATDYVPISALPGARPADAIMRLRIRFGDDAIEHVPGCGYWLTPVGRIRYDFFVNGPGEIPPLNDRIVRVVVRFGGSVTDAMRHTRLSRGAVYAIAARMGLRFGVTLGGFSLDRMNGREAA